MVTLSPEAMQRVPVQGPFWTAEVDVLQLESPRRNWAFRNLFLDQTPLTPAAKSALSLPGSLILLGCVRQVTITLDPNKSYRWRRNQIHTPAAETPAQIPTALATGELALLLLQADPEQWPDLSASNRPINQFFPPLTCIAGEIALGDDLLPDANADQALYQVLNLSAPETPRIIPSGEEATRLITPLMVHSSGLSIYGAIALPWEAQRIASPFQLAQTFPQSGANPLFRLTLEENRLTEAEQQLWIDAWDRLSQYLTPQNPLNTARDPAAPSPHWVTLEVTNPTTVPALFWTFSGDAAPILNFARDSLSLIFSNQSPYDSDNPPTSLGRVVPGSVQMESGENNRLNIQLSAGENPGPAGGESASLPL